MIRVDPRQFDMFAALERAPAARASFFAKNETLTLTNRSDITKARVEASYSAASLSSSGKVTRPFKFRGKEWVMTGGAFLRGDEEFECYRIVPVASFEGPGQPATYHDHDFHGERRASLGGYHGMQAKHGKIDVVLVGPPLTMLHTSAAA